VYDNGHDTVSLSGGVSGTVHVVDYSGSTIDVNGSANSVEIEGRVGTSVGAGPAQTTVSFTNLSAGPGGVQVMRNPLPPPPPPPPRPPSLAIRARAASPTASAA